MATVFRFFHLLALVVWIGGIVFFSFFTAPALFGVLPRVFFIAEGNFGPLPL